MGIETERDKFRIGDIAEGGVRLGSKRQKAQDLLSKAEKGELPVYIELPVTPNDRERGQQSFVRVPAWEMLGTELAPTTPIEVDFGSIDHRYKASDSTVWTPGDTFIKVGLGEVCPLDCVVFREDLERLGIVVGSSPVPDASGEDAQEKPTAEATPAPETANALAAKNRDEKMWLHAAVYALAFRREKEKGNKRFPDERGASANLARHLNWVTEGKPDSKPPREQSPDTFVRVFRTGKRILGREAQPEGKDTRALLAGALTLKKAMAFLAAEVYRNDSIAIRAERISGHLDGAPLNAKPTVDAIVDALKEVGALRE
jgi:hypothetical protein